MADPKPDNDARYIAEMVNDFNERRAARGLQPVECEVFIDTRETLPSPPLTPHNGE